MCTENCKTLLKEFKQNINKWNSVLCSWIGKLVIAKISILLGDLQSQCNLYQLSIGMFFVFVLQKTEKHLKIHMAFQGTLIAKIILNKNNKVEILTHFLISELIAKLQETKQSGTSIETDIQTSRGKIVPRVYFLSLCIKGKLFLIILIRVPRPQNSERILSSTNNWKNNLCTCKILKLDPYFSPYAKKMNWE